MRKASLSGCFFTGETLTPGKDEAILREKLAQTSDYGEHAPGWLIQRLYPLDDSVEIVGEIIPGTPVEVAGDRDLTFSVKLSPKSHTRLGQYFASGRAPENIHVELVKTLTGVAGERFRTWVPQSGDNYIRFKVDAEDERDMRAAGPDPNDWTPIRTLAFRYVRVKGALVVEILGCDAGSGAIEIHPAELVHLSGTPISEP